MKNISYKVIIFLVITLIIIGFNVFNGLYFKSPNRFFSNEPKIETFFLEFKSGGDISFESNVSDKIYRVENQIDIDRIYSTLKSFKIDFFAPHRVSDFNVYLNINQYSPRKYFIKMSKIDNEFVFFYNGYKYRNPNLSNTIVDFLEIRKVD